MLFPFFIILLLVLWAVRPEPEAQERQTSGAGQTGAHPKNGVAATGAAAAVQSQHTAPGLAPNLPGAAPAAQPVGPAAAAFDDTTATGALPTPVPLGRETRDPAGAARVAAQQQADQQRQLEDSAAPRPGQELRNATVTEADLGISFMPRSAQDRAESSRTAEPGYGQTVTTVLRSAATVDATLAFYRKNLQEKLPGYQVELARGGPSFATLTALNTGAGVRVSVFVNQTSPSEVTVSLSRWQAAAPQPRSGG